MRICCLPRSPCRSRAALDDVGVRRHRDQPLYLQYGYDRIAGFALLGPGLLALPVC